MFYIIWNATQEQYSFEDKAAWEAAIEEIAEECCYDIDVKGNSALIDDGDYEEEE